MVLAAESAAAQDTAYARNIISELCSEKYAGRGYVRNGQKKAAKFIAQQYKAIGLATFGKSYHQKFWVPTNTFRSKPQIKVNGFNLAPAVDFLVDPTACSSKGSGIILKASSAQELRSMVQSNSNAPILLEGEAAKSWQTIAELNETFKGLFIIQETGKLIWGGSTLQLRIATIRSKAGKIKVGDSIVWSLKSEWTASKQSNVIGFIPAKNPTSRTIIIGAHYDHLGMMGDVMFPGANDNAGGVAMMLDMARSIAKDPGDVNWYFMAFAAEEIGLVGSEEFIKTRTEAFSDSIVFMLNLDLVATGRDGITAVNAVKNNKQFNRLKAINDSLGYVPQILERDNAMNSDHYYFSQKGIPAFFIYQMESTYQFYHEPGDIAASVSLSGYIGTYRLLMEFLTQFPPN